MASAGRLAALLLLLGPAAVSAQEPMICRALACMRASDAATCAANLDCTWNATAASCAPGLIGFDIQLIKNSADEGFAEAANQLYGSNTPAAEVNKLAAACGAKDQGSCNSTCVWNNQTAGKCIPNPGGLPLPMSQSARQIYIIELECQKQNSSTCIGNCLWDSSARPSCGLVVPLRQQYYSCSSNPPSVPRAARAPFQCRALSCMVSLTPEVCNSGSDCVWSGSRCMPNKVLGLQIQYASQDPAAVTRLYGTGPMREVQTLELYCKGRMFADCTSTNCTYQSGCLARQDALSSAASVASRSASECAKLGSEPACRSSPDCSWDTTGERPTCILQRRLQWKFFGCIEDSFTSGALSGLRLGTHALGLAGAALLAR